MAHRVYMVDVFAEQAYAGNPLAVLISQQPLADEMMQQFAAEMNFSETTFVLSKPERDGGYRVRVFTPVREIAFTGHPILGTAWVIRHHLANANDHEIKLNLAVGQVPVSFETGEDGKTIAWFQAPAMLFGDKPNPEQVAHAVGLCTNDIDATTPIQVVSASTSAIIVPLCSLEALRRARLDLQKFSVLARQGYPPLVYLFCKETHHPGNDLCCRFFFEAHEVREDPATGNGAAFLGAYLMKYPRQGETSLSIRIEQGYEVHRPSLILLRARQQGQQQVVHVGGQVIPTLEGNLL